MMKIYCSCSEGCSDKAKLLFAKISEKGCCAVTQDLKALTKCDALFLFLDGKEHSPVKEDLNLFLDKNAPVAYVQNDTATLDRGLEMQLGLAKQISVKDFDNELEAWLLRSEQIKKKKRSKRLFVVFGSVLLAAVILLKLMDRKKAPIGDTAQSGYIDENSAQTLKKLDLSGKNIEDIEFISDAVNLEELDLSNNRIVDISALSGLKSLKKLNLSGNRIKDISALSQMSKLEELDLSDNDITDINVLLALDSLKTLNISGNDITDTTVLDYMSSVEIIYK